LSGFTITDAIDLEDGERPISLDLSSKIERYGQLTAVDHLSKEQNSWCHTSFTDVRIDSVL
jgi:hypothetical protein